MSKKPKAKQGEARVMNGAAMRDHLALIKRTRSQHTVLGELMLQNAELRKELAQAKGGWVDARKELPDADTTVLVACPKEDEPVWLGFWDGEAWQVIDGYEVVVTHWRHLPEAPGTEDGRPAKHAKGR